MIRTPSSGRGAFSTHEVVVVAIMIGILTAIAVPSYLSVRERSDNAGARAHVRQAVSALEDYRAEHGTYAGATAAVLKATYDSSLEPGRFRLSSLGAKTYCVQASEGDHTWHQTGPVGAPARGGCP